MRIAYLVEQLEWYHFLCPANVIVINLFLQFQLSLCASLRDCAISLCSFLLSVISDFSI